MSENCIMWTVAGDTVVKKCPQVYEILSSKNRQIDALTAEVEELKKDHLNPRIVALKHTIDNGRAREVMMEEIHKEDSARISTLTAGLEAVLSRTKINNPLIARTDAENLNGIYRIAKQALESEKE